MASSARPPRIGVVAGEVSGDALGAGLIRALKRRLPEACFEGIGGPEMIAQGCASWHPIERLSVFGISEVAGRYREIRGIRRDLARRFLAEPPDLFIGIDSPGFNLGLEERLKSAGIPTVHYVSPQVWAWRRWRVRKIRRAVDRMLVLFPFEEDFYRERQVPATFVGHPLADAIPDEVDVAAVRERLELPLDATVVAMLPGSRVSELKAHADLFVRTAAWLAARHPRMQFVVPFVNRETRLVFEEAVKARQAWDLPITRLFGHARDALGVADVALLASGTAALEAALMKRLMVVTYRVSLASELLIRLLTHVEHYAMPNHLAGRRLVPELLQRQATPPRLGEALERTLADREAAQTTFAAFRDMHRALRRGADERAADAVVAMLAEHRA